MLSGTDAQAKAIPYYIHLILLRGQTMSPWLTAQFKTFPMILSEISLTTVWTTAVGGQGFQDFPKEKKICDTKEKKIPDFSLKNFQDSMILIFTLFLVYYL